MFEVFQRKLERAFQDSRGFTLMEAAVGLAILSMRVGLVGSAVFQTLSIQRFWQDDVKASKDTRHAASWFAEDALKATATTLVDGTAVNTVTITTDSGDVTYKLSTSGDQLLREAGSNQNVVAENVADVKFELSEQTVTFTLEVESIRGGTEILTLRSYLRLLDS